MLSRGQPLGCVYRLEQEACGLCVTCGLLKKFQQQRPSSDQAMSADSNLAFVEA